MSTGLAPCAHPTLLREYERHYNRDRPHQGVSNRPLGEWEPPEEPVVIRLEDVRCHKRLGGLLRSYRLAG